MPWEKKKKNNESASPGKPNTEAVSTVGALQHFIVQENLDQTTEQGKS